MGTASDQVQDLIAERLSEAMTVIGQETVADIQDAIGRPYPPSGPAGLGPPARRKGQLQRGVIHYQEVLPGQVVEYIHSTRPPEMKHDDPNVPEYLEMGTDKGRWPYMKPASDRLAERLPDRLQELMTGK